MRAMSASSDVVTYDMDESEVTRAVLCRGYLVEADGDEDERKTLARALEAWAKRTASNGSALPLGFIAHGADRAEGEWPEKPFIVGVMLRVVTGLEGDHRRGLSADALERMVVEADGKLDACDASLRAVLDAHEASIGARKLFLSWHGPLAAARIVKGVWRDEAGDATRWYDADESGAEPAFYECSEGASQDPAPGGVLGFELAMSIYENSDPPIEVTPSLLRAADDRLREHELSPAMLYVFSHYD